MVEVFVCVFDEFIPTDLARRDVLEAFGMGKQKLFEQFLKRGIS